MNIAARSRRRSLVSEAEALVNDADSAPPETTAQRCLSILRDVALSLPLSLTSMNRHPGAFISCLLRLLSGDGVFMCWRLARATCACWKARATASRKSICADLPTSLAEALSEEVIERQLQRHALGRGGRAGRVRQPAGVITVMAPATRKRSSASCVTCRWWIAACATCSRGTRRRWCWRVWIIAADVRRSEQLSASGERGHHRQP